MCVLRDEARQRGAKIWISARARARASEDDCGREKARRRFGQERVKRAVGALCGYDVRKDVLTCEGVLEEISDWPEGTAPCCRLQIRNQLDRVVMTGDAL